MKFNGRKFNFWFSLFILVGMIAISGITCAFNLNEPNARVAMQLIATVGAVMGVINTVLSANGNIWTFVFGFLDVCCCSIVYYDSGIMGNFALHVFYFLPMQFVGFWQWRKRGAETKSHVNEVGERETAKVRARRLGCRQWALVALAFVVGTLAAYTILYFLDSAKLSGGQITEINKAKILLDATVVVLNIIGQILMSLAYMEQWYVWNFVNIFSILLWLNRLLSIDADSYTIVMAVKYCFYLLNSVNGLRIWIRLSQRSSADTAQYL